MCPKSPGRIILRAVPAEISSLSVAAVYHWIAGAVLLREAKLFRKTREVPIMRVKITMACTECKQRNYNTMKNKKNSPDRLEMNKYCRFCKKHTLHRETK